MKKTALWISGLLLLAACGGDDPSDKQTIQYQVGPDQYAVVIVQEEGMTDAAVKEMALKKAAQLTLDKNFRYFTVESEGQVLAMTPSGSNYQAPRNLYYELIQSGNFSRDQFTEGQGVQTQSYPGYRVLIKCYKNSPGPSATDACSLVDCKNKFYFYCYSFA